ncbi:hypothetical protein [Rhizobium sp. NZLR1]|uniref:hypothetical protein n=1 Tax=Rhizobium sp. NZLR1 TaxID=2731096 RepID=UPI001A97E6BF|nr:hypothetical protein [Rhizobium sp. NZLR1]MBX5202426.1 hypothetical protein [Rhizobium sp. NZLR1]QSZ20675.1 hypothetical protein J3O30_20630 [Rhizobium sp. NZLR1]
MTKLKTIAIVHWWILWACFVSSPAFAQEKAYYRGTSWAIQIVHRGTGSEFGDGPYCEVKTTSFEPMSVALQFYPSREAGSYRTIIKLRKSGWQLPIGATVKVKVGNLIKIVSGNQVIEGPPMVFKVETKDTMATLVADYDPNWLAEMGNGLLNGVFLRTKYGSTLWFKFVDGDEPPWNPASFERFEQKLAFSEYQQCLSDLSQMAADPAQGGSTPLSSTSPLKPQASSGADSASQAPPIANDQVEAAARSDVWRFTTAEEDWGETCYAEVRKGDIKVGFMASPGEEIVGFVEGLFTGDTRATWHVDDKRAYVSDGGQSDYSGWHEFDQLPADLLEQMSQGKELSVTGAKGERVVVGLNGATEAIPKFKACFGTPEPDSTAAESPVQPK